MMKRLSSLLISLFMLVLVAPSLFALEVTIEQET